MARPDLGKKWNYAVDVFFDSCDAPFTAYIKAAYPALIHSALSYYCLDPVQIFTGYVRPGGPLKGTRGSGHGRGSTGHGKSKGFWGRFKKAFSFDPNEWVSKKMPFSEDMAGRQVPGGAQWGWAAFSQFERFNNFMFMYTMAENFFYETALGVARSTYCENQRACVFQGYSEMQGHIPILGVSPCVINEVQKARGVYFGGGNGVGTSVPRCTASISCSHITRWDGDPDTSECWLRVNLPTGSPVTLGFENGGINAALYADVRDAGMITFEMGGPHGFWAHDVQFSVFGYRNEPSYQPDDWCAKAFDTAINWAK